MYLRQRKEFSYMMKLAAGDLKHSITIQRYTSTQDDWGQTIKDWQDLFTTRARVRPISGTELFKDVGIIGTLTSRVFLRYKENVKINDRVIHDGRILDIKSVINHEEKNIVLELLCNEIY